MKISALRLFNVKRFAGRGVAIEGIGDGVNVLCAANEHGKSTSFEALHALFFQPHTGAPQAVKNLRPYSGGNPLIEADIVTPEGRYRLSKQFIGGKRATVTDLDTGRLVAQADEAENLIAGLVKGGTAGPAGLLWVRQGITGLEDRPKSEAEGERRVRESLLTSVQGEVEAITGGRRMADLIGICNDELDRLVTPTLRPKAGGPYAEAIEARDRLEGEERRLAEDVAALRDALDRRVAAQKRLREVEDAEDAAARRSEVEAATVAFEAAKAHGDALKTADAELELARSRRDAAAAALERYRETARRAGDLQAELQSAEARRSAVKDRHDAAEAAIETATIAVQEAEAEEQAARDLLERLDKALAARKAAEELGEMQARLQEAEKARVLLENGEAGLARIAVPAQVVDQLQDLEIEIAGLRAAEEAGLPTLRMDYAEDARDRISLNGTPVQGGEEASFGELARLDIPGIGTLTLKSNRPPGSNGSLAEALERRRDMLAAIGVESLAEARRRQASEQEATGELKRLRLHLGHLAPEGLPALRQEVARRTAQSSEMLELKGDPDEARRRLDAASRAKAEARNGLREIQPMSRHSREAQVAAETALATLTAERARIDAELGPEPDRAGREQGLADELARLQQAFEAFEATAAELRGTAPDLASAEAALARTRSVQAAAEQEAARLRETLADLNGQIRTRTEDAVEEAWREASEARSAAAARVAAFETEVAVLNRLKTALQSKRSAARDLYLKPVIAELRPLLGLLFDDISIMFDEKTLLPQTIRRNGQEEEVERLSGGMREQLSVLTRLAFARLLARDGRSAPVILDDALVYSDDDRIELMFDALHRQARDQQIIVFSCRQRAFARLGGNVLEMIDWVPDS